MFKLKFKKTIKKLNAQSVKKTIKKMFANRKTHELTIPARIETS